VENIRLFNFSLNPVLKTDPPPPRDWGLVHKISEIFFKVIDYMVSLISNRREELPLTIEEPKQSLFDSLKEKIRENPKTSIAIGVGIGLIVASSLYFYTSSLNTPPPLTSDLKQKITVFTSFTTQPDRVDLSEKVAATHKAYCDTHGYEYLVFRENLAKPALPYWSKIAGMNQLLNDKSFASREWFVWLDDDMVMMNHRLKIENIAAQFKDFSVALTEDIALPNINTGILFVKNDDSSRMIFQRLWEMRNQISESGYSYAACPNQVCLHEQEALQSLITESSAIRKLVKILPQRGALKGLRDMGINTFQRLSHYDFSREMTLHYNDPEEIRGAIGDFATQCTGMATDGELLTEEGWFQGNLREMCIDDLISKVVK